jgi:signal transduction histidine kinase
MRFSSLSFQLVGVMLTLTLGLGLIRTYLNRAEVEALAREQFERRSVATASAFAAYATDAVLTNDLFRLNELVNETLLNNPDVRYILVLDTEGRLLTHSFGRGAPKGLVAANRIAQGERYHAQRIETEEGAILDMAVPLFEGRIGAVRVGMSERAMNADIDRHTFNLLLVTGLSLIPVAAAAYFLARVMASPLEKLVQVTGAVARGDFSRAAPVAGQDEIAQLGNAFNAMTRALAQSQGELRASNEQLRQRNDELAALNAFASAISQSPDLHALLERALEQTLAVTNRRAGWILLREDDGTRTARGIKMSQVADCRAEIGADARIAHNGQLCPVVEQCHVVIPLASRVQMWGALNVVCDGGDCFSAEQLRLLTAMGQQIGLAIENLELAEQQRREQLRRQLLDRVIDAQEDERKRIARELHDEFAQSLTALIVGLQTLEQTLAPEDATRERLAETRILAARILDQTRRMIFNLRPTVLDDAGLAPALRSFAERACAAAPLELEFQISGAARRLAPQVETALFRIAQEAVNNVVKHARARQARVRLQFDAGCVAASVEDDGAGFIVEDALRAGAVGLLGMRERAELVGGRLEIESRIGQGTRVQVEIPT